MRSTVRNTRAAVVLATVLIALNVGDTRGSAAPKDRVVAGPPSQAFGNLPLNFVANRGQSDARVQYVAQGLGYAFYLTRREIVLALVNSAPAPPAVRGHTVAMRFVGGDPDVAIDGGRKEGVVSYLRGSDASRWHAELPAYTDVVYRRLWPGVDLHIAGRSGTLKYEFHVAAGADPSAIRLAYDGASSLTIDETGGLLIGTSLGPLRDAAPASYQDIEGRRIQVASRYVLAADGNARGAAFSLGRYRTDRELVIDPGIEYTTLLGGAAHEMPGGMAVDGAGNVYITGFTQSADFPTTPGAFDTAGAAQTSVDAFVTKLNPTGTALVYSTFVGGNQDFDWGRRIAVDGSGNAYVVGQTKSGDFPTTNGAFDRTLAIPPNCPRCFADNYDAFVLKLNATGSALLYSTYLGGTDYDDPRGIAIDSAGNAYVTGETSSLDFPTTAGSFQPLHHGDYDVFVTKLNASGSALVYSTFVGGTLVDDGERIVVDSSGQALVMGFSRSPDFPTTAGVYDGTPNGGFDITLTKLNAAGSGLVFSTLLGGSDMDSGGGLALDAAGNIYVSGGTASLDFPTTAGAYDTTPTGGDTFVAKLNPTGSQLLWSTLIGGSSGASDVAPDAAGNVWITGTTGSAAFPVTADAVQSAFRGVADAFISKLSADGAALLYSTFLGGQNSDSGDDIAVSSNGSIYVTGHTYSLDFPATAGAFDTVWNGDASIFWGDAWVTKVDPNRTTSTPPAAAPTPAMPTLVSPPNNDPGTTQPITFQWNAAVGSASYQIQIDDSSGFTAPLVRSASVSGSTMYATTGLATVTHFWRVRGVNVNGAAGPWSAVRSFTPAPAPPPAALSTMDTNPSSVVGGNSSTSTVVLSTGAPDGGAVIAFSSSSPSIASVPASATVPANGFTATVTITTAAVPANTIVTITASYNGETRTANLTVTTPAGAVTMQSLQLSPSSVTGGSGSQGVVTLTAPAPSGGQAVSLSSSSTAVSVPATMTVAAGSQTGVFNLSTSSVTASTAATISASSTGTTKTATLTVNPAAPPPPPPQTAALSLTVTGRSGVHVTSTPAGLDVISGSSKTASFTVGTSITLTVGSGRDAVFSGACSKSKSKSCTFTLNGTASVTANVQ